MEKTTVTFTTVSEEGLTVSIKHAEKTFRASLRASLADGLTVGAIRTEVLDHIEKIVFTGHYLGTPQSVSLVASFDHGISEVYQPEEDVVSFEVLNLNYCLQIAGCNPIQLDESSFYRALSSINSVSASIVALGDPGDDKMLSLDPEEWQ